mgnify:CR=1 FL=1
MKELTMQQFIDQVASTDPTKGGGSVSALSGALGVSLMLMVARLLRSKNKFEEYHTTLDEMIDTLDKVSVMFTNFIQQDSEAFDQVMLAFKMPKETETEKLIRNQAIQQGFLNASFIPLQVMQRVNDVANISLQLLSLCPPSFKSDAEVGVLMLNSCFEGAKKNVLINCDSIDDEHQVIQIKNKVDEAAHQWKYYYNQLNA